MSRLPTLSSEEMTPRQAEILKGIINGARGDAGGVFLTWLRSPEMADAAQELGSYLRFRSSLPLRLSELAILVTARHWTAQFEWHVHAPIAIREGLSETIVDSIRERRKPAFEREDEQVVFDFSTAVCETKAVDQALFDRARVELGEQALVDLVAILGYYAFVAMTLNVFDIPVPEGTNPPLAP